MYRLSARQLLAVALVSALFAAGAIAVVDRLANRVQPSGSAFSSATPAGITDPTIATDEQNNIEIYRSLSPGVVNVLENVLEDVSSPESHRPFGLQVEEQ